MMNSSYVVPDFVWCLFGNIKRQVGPFSGRIVGLYRTFLLGLSIFVLIHALDDYFADHMAEMK
eukprot:6202437-Amphidinium_carterae.1